MSFKVTYNSPVILTFTLLSFIVLLIDTYVTDLTGLLALPGNFSWSSPGDYLRLFTYTFVHAGRDFKMQTDFSHFVGNFMLILLIGPVLEEKYGATKLILMMVVTAAVTGILNALISNHGIIGASGLAFMMIVLGSFSNYRKGDLPMTFIIICIFFLGNEIVSAFGNDQISQFAHLMGGMIGGAFGFHYNK
jgi:membrane associated rhomboid family serine protease